MQASLFSEMKEFTNKIPNQKHDEIWLFMKHLPKHIISFRIQIQIYSEKTNQYYKTINYLSDTVGLF